MNQFGATGAEIVDSVRIFFEKVSAVFVELWYWPVIFLGLMILSVVVMSFLVRFSYENRILKSVNKLNKYFLSKPYITDENLVEFNLKMKKVPKVLRTNWQIFMLNREDEPTKYININSCIDKPLRTSSIEKNMSNYTVFTIFLTFFSFVVGLQYANLLGQNRVGETIFTACIIPFLLVLIYTIFILIIRASKNDIYACLYDNFPLYERNLTKATSTLPSYVDYEILFTKKEIKEGIPILQQYLEKRALIEQKELEKARENSVAVEEYDFDDLGIDGSLVLERSMKESETFLRVRKKLEDERNSIEAEKESYQKTYETNLKDMQRQLQTSRENLESLKKQLEESTNRIEANYIKKQQDDEIKKQEQLEKDIESATTKFNEEQVSLQQAIDRCNKEIEEKKLFVQQAMNLEFKHYANTLYKALTDKAVEVANQKLLALSQENSDLKTLLTDIQGAGATEEMSNPEDSLIQNSEVTEGNLYDLNNNGENEQTEEFEQVGADNENNQFETNQNYYTNQEQVNENLYDGQESQQVQNDDNINDINQSYDGQTDVGDVDQNQYDNSNIPIQNEDEFISQARSGGDSGGVDQFFENERLENQQQYNSSESSSLEDSDDINQIQRQIEEENNKLKKEKEEFENNINDTISKMDSKSSNFEITNEENDDYEDEKQDFKESNDDEKITHSGKDDDNSDFDEDDDEDDKEEDVLEEIKPKPRKKPAKSRRIVKNSEDEDGRKVRRGRASLRSRSKTTKEKVVSEIDNLNAEMQKLLDSAKK